MNQRWNIVKWTLGTNFNDILIHWSQMTHICVSKLTIVGCFVGAGQVVSICVVAVWIVLCFEVINFFAKVLCCVTGWMFCSVRSHNKPSLVLDYDMCGCRYGDFYNAWKIKHRCAQCTDIWKTIQNSVIHTSRNHNDEIADVPQSFLKLS